MIEFLRREQYSELLLEFVVLRAQFLKMHFAPFKLMAEFVNLALLPDVAHAAHHDNKANERRLERRSKTDRRRLVFSIPCHVSFFPKSAIVNFCCAGWPPTPLRPVSLLFSAPTSIPACADGAILERQRVRQIRNLETVLFRNLL